MEMIEPSVKHILERLVSYKSVTPSDAGCLSYIEKFLQNLGFHVIIKTFGNKYKVKNLYAYLDTTNYNFCFSGHVDVVPTGEETLWKYNPFTLTHIDNTLYGRGTNDMKGMLAAYLYALQVYLKENKHVQYPLSLLITSDEEGEAKFGTKAMLEYLNKKFDMVLVGEPSSIEVLGDNIRNGRRSSLRIKLEIYGKEGHVAYEEQYENPIRKLLQILESLYSINYKNSVFEVVKIDTNWTANNVIPSIASATLVFRFSHEVSKDTILENTRNRIKKYTNNYNLKYILSAESFISKDTKLQNIALRSIEKVCEIEGSTNCLGGTSDARFFPPYCDNIIELGLPQKTAHKIDEHINVNELHLLSELYLDIITNVCSHFKTL